MWWSAFRFIRHVVLAMDTVWQMEKKFRPLLWKPLNSCLTSWLFGLGGGLVLDSPTVYVGACIALSCKQKLTNWWLNFSWTKRIEDTKMKMDLCWAFRFSFCDSILSSAVEGFGYSTVRCCLFKKKKCQPLKK